MLADRRRRQLTGPFDQEFARKLERLTLIARRLRRGAYRGEHRTSRHGSGLDFADYRAYQPGDDFRYIDWNIYSRLNRLFVKVFTSDDSIDMHVLLDSSSSMGSTGAKRAGGPTKLAYAARLAGALAYVAVHNSDRVTVSSFAGSVHGGLPPLEKRDDVFELFDYLGRLQAGGTTDINTALASYARAVRRPGIAVVISDLLSHERPYEGIRALLGRGFDVIVLQLLTPEELSPSVRGVLELVDSETGELEQRSVDRETRAAYRAALERYTEELRSFSAAHDVEYLRVSTDTPLETVMLLQLRGGRFLR